MPDELKCNATLEIGDDYGDNHCTMRCQHDMDHDGPHEEHYVSDSRQKVSVIWTKEKVV